MIKMRREGEWGPLGKSVRTLLAVLVTLSACDYLHAWLHSVKITFPSVDMVYAFSVAAIAYMSIRIFMRRWRSISGDVIVSGFAIFSAGLCATTLFTIALAIFMGNSGFMEMEPHLFAGLNFISLAMLDISYRKKQI